MAYRSDEQALGLRLDQLEREHLSLCEQEARLEQELRQERELEAQAAARLKEAGPGGGLHRLGRRDRIDLAVLVLVLLSLPLIYFHVTWHPYVHRDPTVIPAILWLGTPGLLGAILAWPYRSRGSRFRLLLLFALLFAMLPLANLLVP